MGKKVKSMAYYELLGVEADATPEELRKAYRRKALQLHPDKRGNTPEAQDEFTRMKQAYDVLSDPQKREIYDHSGEDGIKLMENYGSMGPEELMTALFASLGAVGPLGRCLLMFVITLLFSFFLIIPLFWALRVDHTISWSWVVVFTPMWIVDVCFYCCMCCMVCSSSSGDPEENKKPPVLARLYKFLKSLLLLVLQIFIAMKLNGDIDWSVREVLLPYYVFDALSFIETIVAGVVGYRLLTKNSEGAGVSTTENIKQQRTELVASKLVHLVLVASRLVQGALIALKVDGKLDDASWWAVFIPVWVYVAYFLSGPVSRYFKVRAKNKEQQKPKDTNSQQPAYDAYTRESVHEDEDEPSKNPFMDAFCTVLFIAVMTSPYFILAARLEDGSFSAIYILLPWFIIVALLMCFIFCAIAFIGNIAEEHEAQTAHDVRSPTGDDVPA